MRLYDILNDSESFQEIEKTVQSMYPTEKWKLDKYQSVYYDLLLISAVSPSILNGAYEHIVIRHSTMDGTWNASLRFITSDSFSAPFVSESREALRLSPWSYILGMNILCEIDGEISKTQEMTLDDRKSICASILYEMTWLGFSEGAIRRMKAMDKGPKAHA